MGAGQSTDTAIGGSSMGYQVLRVYPNSPGSRAGLKAYFDFIISIGNTRFSKESGSLREILKASVDQKLRMTVFNTRTRRVREVEIVPSTNWGGNGLLGVSIKHTSFERADERVWHVVDVEPGSPAQQAGFKVGQDYVIGSDSILQESDDLYNLVEAHEGKALKLFLYNVNTDNCREVICHPNSKWGGKGYLGCEFGHGLLHRIPDGSSGADDESPRAPLLASEQPAPTSDHYNQQPTLPPPPVPQPQPTHHQPQPAQQQPPQPAPQQYYSPPQVQAPASMPQPAQQPYYSPSMAPLPVQQPAQQQQYYTPSLPPLPVQQQQQQQPLHQPPPQQYYNSTLPPPPPASVQQQQQQQPLPQPLPQQQYYNQPQVPLQAHPQQQPTPHQSNWSQLAGPPPPPPPPSQPTTVTGFVGFSAFGTDLARPDEAPAAAANPARREPA